MDLKQIAYFMRVYEERSFSRAAIRAQVVQPTLSMQVRKVEEEFGVKLFQRGSRGVEPTTAGHKFYERCVPIARNMELAHQEMMEAHRPDTVSGPIRVGLPSSFNRGLLSGLLLPFMERHLEVEITIYEAYTGTLIDWVQEGKVDFAIGARPPSKGGLVQRLFYRDRVVLVSSVALAGPSYTPCDLAGIDGLKLILPARDQGFGALARKLRASGEIKVEKSIEINGTVGSFDLMQSSDWGLLTSFISVLKEIDRPGVFIYPVGRPKIPFDLYLVYDGRRPLIGASRLLLKAIKADLQRVDALWLECARSLDGKGLSD